MVVKANTIFLDVPFKDSYVTQCEWKFTKLPSGLSHCRIYVLVEFKKSLFGGGGTSLLTHL